MNYPTPERSTHAHDREIDPRARSPTDRDAHRWQTARKCDMKEARGSMLAARCRFSSVPSPRLVRAPMCTYCSTLLLSRDSSVLLVPPPPLSRRTLFPLYVALPSRHSQRVRASPLFLPLFVPRSPRYTRLCAVCM